MRCKTCNAENGATAKRCAACGKRLGSPRRGLAEESVTPFSPEAEARGRLALRAYRLSVFGLIPFVGLILGPVAAVLGAVAHHRGKSDPAFKAKGPALAAIILGFLITVTNWVGVTLMLVGWFGS
jgi:hypothetical protein